MTGLDVDEDSEMGILAFYSIIHKPREILPTISRSSHAYFRSADTCWSDFTWARDAAQDGRYGGLPCRRISIAWQSTRLSTSREMRGLA